MCVCVCVCVCLHIPVCVCVLVCVCSFVCISTVSTRLRARDTECFYYIVVGGFFGHSSDLLGKTLEYEGSERRRGEEEEVEEEGRSRDGGRYGGMV